MAMARAVNIGGIGAEARAMYDDIGDFLVAQRLGPEPGNYAFAHAIMSEPDGALARAVRVLTDGGVRLTRRAIEQLGGDIIVSPREMKARADGLVARAQMQVDSFGDTINAIHAETKGFGRDLAASMAAMQSVTEDSGDASDRASEIARITAAMVERVNAAESQLETATRESAELRAKLEEARDNARRDPLTNLPNRRAFEEAYAAQRASGAALCLAVCDIDHFKSVNDRFGHVVGDRVLKTVATTLAEACHGHLVARYGGEEFVVLFSGVDLDTARITLDTARAKVAGKHYKVRETDEPLGVVTFSAGATVVATDEVVGAAFHRADRLLYEAKAGGRNCVRVAAD